MSETRCPMCGKPNPIDRTTCAYCQAQLKPIWEQPGNPQPFDTGGDDWLNAFRDGESDHLFADTPASDELDWLSSPSTPQTPSEQVNLSDWLTSLDNDSAPAAPSTPAWEAAPPAADLPDWLSGMSDEPATPATPSTPAWDAAPPAAADLPDWLSGMSDEPAAPDVAVAASSKDEFSFEQGNLPDWLSQPVGEVSASQTDTDLRGNVSPFEMDDDFSATFGSFSQQEPDWLSGISSETDSEAETPESQAAASIAPGTLPDWVEAMRPVESVMVSAARFDNAAEPVETTGPLSGLRGVLPTDLEVIRPGKPPRYSLNLDITQAQQEQIALLNSLLQNEEKSAALPQASPITSQRLLRLIIAIVMFSMVFWALVTGQSSATLDFPPPEVNAVKSLVDQLPPNSAVLVAFDYEPGFSGEMSAASAALIDHLMLRGSLLTLVSTTPSGPMVAEQFIQQQMAKHLYTAGEEYINLGYISGGAMGLASFAQRPQQSMAATLGGNPAWQSKPLQDIAHLSNFALVVVISDSPELSRAWIEQVQPVLKGTPLVMVVSAQAEPLIRPYYQETSETQIQGYIAGLAGGGAYDQNTLGGIASARWNAFSAGITTALGLIVLGVVLNAILALLAQTKRKKGA